MLLRHAFFNFLGICYYFSTYNNLFSTPSAKYCASHCGACRIKSSFAIISSYRVMLNCRNVRIWLPYWLERLLGNFPTCWRRMRVNARSWLRKSFILIPAWSYSSCVNFSNLLCLSKPIFAFTMGIQISWYNSI